MALNFIDQILEDNRRAAEGLPPTRRIGLSPDQTAGFLDQGGSVLPGGGRGPGNTATGVFPTIQQNGFGSEITPDLNNAPAAPAPPSTSGGQQAFTQEFPRIDPVNVPIREFPKPENPFLEALREALLNPDAFSQLTPEQNSLLGQAQDVTAGRGAVRGLGAPTQASLISATAPLLANFRQQNIGNALQGAAAQSTQDLGFRGQDISSFLGQLNNLTGQRAQDITQQLGLGQLDLQSALGFGGLNLKFLELLTGLQR